MGRGAIVALCAVAGCYAPTVGFGVPCSATGMCPRGQVCDPSNTCVASVADAGADSNRDGDVPDDTTVLPGWSPPLALASLNTANNDSDASLTDDALEIYFMSDRQGSAGGMDLYHSMRTTPTAAFATPVRAVELGGSSNEYSPEISGDGLTIYFTSNRSGGYDVFRATRQSRDDQFDLPAIVAALSTTGDDINVSVSGDGLVAIVDRDTPTADRELFGYVRSSTTAAWTGGAHLVELTGARVDGSPTLDAHGLVILFQSDRLTAGSYDIWMATRANTAAAFSAPQVVTELSTSSSEGNPFVSADVRRIVFSRGPANSRDLYETTR